MELYKFFSIFTESVAIILVDFFSKLVDLLLIIVVIIMGTVDSISI